MDRDAALKQLDKVTVAMNTVAITKSLESKYELSLEILRLGKIVPIKPEKVMKMREEFGLVSAIWILAEKKIHEEEGV